MATAIQQNNNFNHVNFFNSDNVNNRNETADMNTKLMNFLQEIRSNHEITEPLNNRIEKLALDSNSWSILFPSYYLTELQIYGVILSFISETGNHPSIEELQQYLTKNHIKSSINTGIVRNIINSFENANPNHPDNTNINHYELNKQAKTQYYENTLKPFANNVIPSEENLTLLKDIISKYNPFRCASDTYLDVEHRFISRIYNILQIWKEDNEEYYNYQLNVLIRKILIIIVQGNRNTQIEITFANLIFAMGTLQTAVLIRNLYLEHKSNNNSNSPEFGIGNNPAITVSQLIITRLDENLFPRIMINMISCCYLPGPELNRIISQVTIPTQMRRDLMSLVENKTKMKHAMTYYASIIFMVLITGRYYTNNLGIFVGIIGVTSIMMKKIERLSHENREIYDRLSGRRNNNTAINSNQTILSQLSNETQNNFMKLLTKLSEEEKVILQRIMNLLSIHNNPSESLIEVIEHSIISMNKNQMIREKCMEIARNYSTTCADGFLIVLLLWNIEIQTSTEKISLKDAVTIAKTELQINEIFEYVIKKLNNQTIDIEVRNQNDPIEVALWLLIELQRSNIININGINQMKFENMAIADIRKYKISLTEVIKIVENLDPIELLKKIQKIFFEVVELKNTFEQESDINREFMEKFNKISDDYSEQLEESYTNTPLNSEEILITTHEIQVARAQALLEHIVGFIHNQNQDYEEHK